MDELLKKADITVIGGGPGGYAAAIFGARMGASVTLIEKNKLGGTCLNAGCIPTKALLKCAGVYAAAASAPQYGVEYGQAKFDFSKMMDFKNRTVMQLVSGVHHLVRANKINLIQGEGLVLSPDTVLARTAGGDERILSGNIIVATGASESVIPGFEPDGKHILNSTQMLSLTELPRRLVIVGGGVIGVEFATIFKRLGVEVTIVELTARLIPTEDPELSKGLRASLEKSGVVIHLESAVLGLEKNSEGEMTIKMRKPDGSQQSAACDKVLICVGRKASVQDVGIVDLGVRVTQGRIDTDEHMRTSVPGIYAVGDVTPSEQLAHAAYLEARTAVSHIMGRPGSVDYSAIPHCIYTSPEAASVGMSEQKAGALQIEAKAVKIPFYGNGKAIIEGHTEGFVKLVFGVEEGNILGASIFGPKATELIAELALAVQNKMRVEDVINTVHAHPTLSEAVGEAAMAAAGLNLHSV